MALLLVWICAYKLCSEYIALPCAEVQTNQIFKLTLLDNERFMSVIQKKMCAGMCHFPIAFQGKNLT